MADRRRLRGTGGKFAHHPLSPKPITRACSNRLILRLGKLPCDPLGSGPLSPPASSSPAEVAAVDTAEGETPILPGCSKGPAHTGLHGNRTGARRSSLPNGQATRTTWSAAGPLSTVRANHTATLLQNGSVLLVGGFSNAVIPNVSLASTDLYNPATNTFAASGSLTTSRYGHPAVLMPNGRALAAGGEVETAGMITQTASAEIYDPATGNWASAATMGPGSSPVAYA